MKKIKPMGLCKQTNSLPAQYPRSVLRYPGGKTRAVKQICSYIPTNEKLLCSPFLGGASVELACSTRMLVYGYDVFEPLIAFWHEVLTAPGELAAAVNRYYPLSRTNFYKLQKTFTMLRSRLSRAAAFYVLNRASFSGTTLSGGMSPGHPRFTKSSIQRLKEFRATNFKVHMMDFRESIERHKDAFLYLDPPYLIGQALYGLQGDAHRGFDHAALADILHNRNRWILSYNDCVEIRKCYKGYRILELEWAYGMNKSRSSNEILIIG
jgi:DNA adenine methylase